MTFIHVIHAFLKDTQEILHGKTNQLLKTVTTINIHFQSTFLL